MNRPLLILCTLLLSLSLAACGKKDVQPDEQPVESDAPESQPDTSTDTSPDEADESAADPDALPAPEDVSGIPDDATVRPSGLASRILTPGTGTTNPGPTSVVRVHYTGWTTDGKMFDSSVVRNEPISFPLDKVIKGWQEGVQLMVEGETRRLWIPSEMAYGDNPKREGAPAGMLVFDVQHIAIETP